MPVPSTAAPAAPADPPPRKRRRLVISCTECHRRKQKCDRDLPCANCRSRNKESSCTYETTAKSPDKARDESQPQQQPRQQQKKKTSKNKAKGSPATSTTSPPPASLSSSSSTKLPTSTSAHHQEETSGAGTGGALTSFAATLGYSSMGESTMSFLRRLETQKSEGNDDYDEENLGTTFVASRGGYASSRDAGVLKEKFKSLIRQLPSRSYLDKLVDIFMRTFNDQYYVIDPDILQSQLERWHALPFKVLSAQGPQALSPEMRAFPAVLFQIIATSLLIVVEGGELAATFEGLKFAASMSFEDLSADYSEAGVGIIALIEKKSLTVTAIQAEFLRASFLKFTADVTESWHAISTTIRDAQELGMHRDCLDPRPVDDSAEAALENQWYIQRRRHLYMVLATWDISMSAFLGRPGIINRKQNLPTFPVDSVRPRDRSRTPVMPRDELRDPPTPIAAGLWLMKISEPLFDVQDLESEGYLPKDYRKVDQIHDKILAVEEEKPAFLREENPDTRWDNRPDTGWIALKRHYFTMLHGFSLMVLHRPYVFHRRKSREEALKASLIVLEMGGKMFEDLPPDHWRNHHLFFGTFDALVLSSTIYVLFPGEQPGLRDVALEQFHWAVERFSAMQERNPLAKSALGVLKGIQAKFVNAIHRAEKAVSATPTGASISSTPASNRVRSDSAKAGGHLSLGSTHQNGQGQYSPAQGEPLLTGTSSNYSSDGGGLQGAGSSATSTFAPTPVPGSMPPAMSSGGFLGDWSMDGLDLTSLQPVYPTYDLLFNDLNVVEDGAITMANFADVSPPTMIPGPGQQEILDGSGGGVASTPWQFDGGFGDDTVWKLLNQW